MAEVFSDEIHADFIWKKKHQAFLTVGEHFDQICVTATAPSKTFNLAGLQVSNIVIKNEELRQRFQKAIAATGSVGRMQRDYCPVRQHISTEKNGMRP